MPERFLCEQFRIMYDMEKLKPSLVDKSLTNESKFEFNERLGFVMVIHLRNTYRCFKIASIRYFERHLLHKIKWLKNGRRPWLQQRTPPHDNHYYIWWLAQATFHDIQTSFNEEDLKVSIQKVAMDKSSKLLVHI